jgi:hypothetical protein
MRYLLPLVALVVLAGCGAEPKKEPVALENVPEPVMNVAKEKLPEVKFEKALKKPNGEFEIIGKDRQGKVREIDLTPSGNVTEIE